MGGDKIRQGERGREVERDREEREGKGHLNWWSDKFPDARL